MILWGHDLTWGVFVVPDPEESIEGGRERVMLGRGVTMAPGKGDQVLE